MVAPRHQRIAQWKRLRDAGHAGQQIVVVDTRPMDVHAVADVKPFAEDRSSEELGSSMASDSSTHSEAK
jgi:hypothetical protein